MHRPHLPEHHFKDKVNWFKPGRGHVLKINFKDPMLQSEARAAFVEYLHTLEISEMCIHAFYGVDLTKNFTVIFKLDQYKHNNQIFTPEQLTSHVKDSTKRNDGSWHTPPAIREDGLASTFSFSFEKSKAQTVKETFTRQVELQLLSTDKDLPLTAVRRNGLIRSGHTIIMSVSVTAYGDIQVKLGDAHAIQEKGINFEALKRIVDDKKVAFSA